MGFFCFFFSDRNIDSNKKLFPPFQVRGNDGVTERSLPPNFGACQRLYTNWSRRLNQRREKGWKPVIWCIIQGFKIYMISLRRHLSNFYFKFRTVSRTGMAKTSFLHWCFDLNFSLASFICNWKLHILFMLYTFWTYFWSVFNFLNILKLHENYLNSCEGKEYVRRNLKCISTLIKPRPFLRLLVRVVLNF